jgi:hypothetical protein
MERIEHSPLTAEEFEDVLNGDLHVGDIPELIMSGEFTPDDTQIQIEPGEL